MRVDRCWESGLILLITWGVFQAWLAPFSFNLTNVYCRNVLQKLPPDSGAFPCFLRKITAIEKNCCKVDQAAFRHIKGEAEWVLFFIFAKVKIHIICWGG